jgi:Ca2+-transporting ATPase
MPARLARELAWHTLATGEAIAALDSDAERGLSTAEARRRIAEHGPNALPEAKRRSLVAMFASQFKSPLIYLLLGAAVVAIALGEVSDAIVIAAVVVINAAIGAYQEGRAERSLAALRRIATVRARVVRDGTERVVEARDLVPGDVVLVATGDAVPADARVLDPAALELAEAALTGESAPVRKDLGPLGGDTALGDRNNMIYAGTHVTAGRARAVVVATGTAMEVGRIATLAERAEVVRSPLERRIAAFGKYVIVAAVVLFVVIVAVGLVRGIAFADLVMVGVSQVVGMIPEGLPVAVTIALAVGVQRMARRRAIVRELAAVETLGSTTVICTDKTGTLTKNEMTVTELRIANRTIAVTGAGYAPAGGFFEGGRELAASDDPDVRALLEAGVLCSDASLVGSNETGWKALGDPTEIALVTAAVKAGVTPARLRERHRRRAELAFDSGAMRMATEHDREGASFVVIKGAPEVVLSSCDRMRRDGRSIPLDEAARAELHAAVAAMGARALRVLAIATVDGAAIDRAAGFGALDSGAELLGLVGQIDPPRPEGADAVAVCASAGIRPVMITGDHEETGLAIARALGMADESDRAIAGSELDALSDEDLTRRLGSTRVFARVHPAQKLRIVEAYQARHDVVAMTGDGVNDAPALARADVGVAMGVSGTDVAKEAAKIVLADDNFASIVAAVEEGRIVYRNIKKAVLLLVASSAAEVGVLLGAIALGFPPPFVAVQILWNNLVTEGLVTVNLVMEPREGDEMRARPTSAGESLLTRAMLTRIAFMTPTIVVATLGWFIARIEAGVPLAEVRSETFTLLAVCEWFNVLNCRSETRSALRLDLFENRWLLGGLIVGNLLQVAIIYWPPLNSIFHTAPFDIAQVLAIGAVGSSVLWVEELRKAFVRRRAKRART